jgi:hypothetical protein
MTRLEKFTHIASIVESTFVTWRTGMARYRDELSRPQWAGWERNFSPEFVAFFGALQPTEFVGF